MRCPVSGEDLIIVEFEGVELDVSPGGHGLWFDRDELQQLFDATGVPEGLHDLEERLQRLPHPKEHGHRRRCPRCHARMWHVQAPGHPDPVVLDACPHEHGLWFDKGELEQILASELDEQDKALAKVREFLGAFAEPLIDRDETSPEAAPE